jgi:hypothetical protein
MIGRRLEQIGRALVRPLTFDRIVACAVADLQLESGGGTWSRVRGIASVWCAIGGALADEVAGDAAVALRAMATPAAVMPSVATFCP